MTIAFDRAKDAINRKKHGISLARAEDFDFDAAIYEIDGSQDYGEVRYFAIGFIDGRLFSLTFTMNGEEIRAISLRKATKDDEKNFREGQ
jgi:uncharacterized DUF497 family protein